MYLRPLFDIQYMKKQAICFIVGSGDNGENW